MSGSSSVGTESLRGDKLGDEFMALCGIVDYDSSTFSLPCDLDCATSTMRNIGTDFHSWATRTATTKTTATTKHVHRRMEV